MNKCSVCGNAANFKCTGCDTGLSYLCREHARPCFECGQGGPYCPDCNVKECGCNTGYSDLWKCEECREDFRSRDDATRCADCDDYAVHKFHWHRCTWCEPSGAEHYLCNSYADNGWEEHACVICYSVGGPARFCCTEAKVKLPWGVSVVICREHRPQLKQWADQLIEGGTKKRKL